MLHSDSSNEGMIHISRPIFSTQFHPEAKGGPTDTAFLFDIYLESVQRYKNAKYTRVLHVGDNDGVRSLLLSSLAKERVGVQTDSVTFASTSGREI